MSGLGMSLYLHPCSYIVTIFLNMKFFSPYQTYMNVSKKMLDVQQRHLIHISTCQGSKQTDKQIKAYHKGLEREGDILGEGGGERARQERERRWEREGGRKERKRERELGKTGQEKEREGRRERGGQERERERERERASLGRQGKKKREKVGERERRGRGREKKGGGGGGQQHQQLLVLSMI